MSMKLFWRERACRLDADDPPENSETGYQDDLFHHTRKSPRGRSNSSIEIDGLQDQVYARDIDITLLS